MPLLDRINNDMKDAMRARDELKLSTLRMALAAVRKAEDQRVASAYDAWIKSHPNSDGADFPAQPEGSDDAAVLSVLDKEVKQRRDSIDQFRKANRLDLAQKEEAEMAVLTAYLPEQMSRTDIEAAVRAVIEQVGAKGPSDKNKVMPVVIGQTKGKADGREVNEVVTELLASLG